MSADAVKWANFGMAVCRNIRKAFDDARQVFEVYEHRAYDANSFTQEELDGLNVTLSQLARMKDTMSDFVDFVQGVTVTPADHLDVLDELRDDLQ